MKTPQEPTLSPAQERQARLDLGAAYLAAGLVKDAMEEFEAVLRDDPEDRAALDGLERARAVRR